MDRLTSTAYGADASLKLGAQSLSNMLYAYALLNHHPGTELLSGEGVSRAGEMRAWMRQTGVACCLHKAE